MKSGAPGVDWEAVEERFIRASGPGGQHVNTSATAVQLRYDLGRVDMPRPVRERLRKLAGQRLNSDGVLILEASEFRSQERNRRAVRERLLRLLEEAWKQPRKRIPTRPGPAARKRRLEGKKRRSTKKQLRRPPED